MTIEQAISFTFKFDGQIYSVNRIGYESVEQFKTIADDMLVNGLYSTALYEKYNPPTHTPQTITNTFRSGPGQMYLLKLILDDQIEPHEDFWSNEVGRNIDRELQKRGATPKVVR